MNRVKAGFIPYFLLILALLVALAVAIATIVAILMPDEYEVKLLLIYMVGTGAFSIAAVYFLHRARLVQRFSSLRWTILTTVVVMVALVLINVFFTARLMFIREQDVITITALLIFGGVVAVISALFISSTLIERIQALGDASERVARGELDTRLTVTGNDELAQLGHMFNRMATELAALDQKQRQLEQTRRDLVAWASHDLRSPLAALWAMNEAIMDGVVTDAATQAQYRRQMQREIEHMGRLIDDLFDLAQLDTHELPLQRKPTDMGMLIEEAVEGTQARAREAGLTLTHAVENGLPLVSVAPDKMARVLYNLLDNALHHTPNGGCISVSAAQAQGGVLIRVHNTGSKIAAADLPRVFERFYRGEAARAQRRDGQRSAGLGLAIARGFVEAHGGRITVESGDDGTAFGVWVGV
ncbi:MAG: HAMP domain-containing sensor histidine kinase [Chloroflexota bacterium]|nr:HAMP domain-containing sensor histidine kinase [Chloroflexota bacterium]